MIPLDKNPIGFDFDNTLSKPKYQLLADYFNSLNKTLFVITKESPNEEIYTVTDKVNIPRRHVLFTSNGPKSPLINQNKIELFYDDLQENLDEINKNAPSCQTILAI